jgi:ABC-type dipeptide/oligopeptide/nickel transport system ATPase component
VPSPINPPTGCRFHTRCPYAFDRCRVEEPAMLEVRPGHQVACHLREPDATSRMADLTGTGRRPK